MNKGDRVFPEKVTLDRTPSLPAREGRRDGSVSCGRPGPGKIDLDCDTGEGPHSAPATIPSQSHKALSSSETERRNL